MKQSEVFELGELFRAFFFERLFSIHYKYFDKRIGKTNFEIASGFCTLHKEIPMFVTCAHFLRDLSKRLDENAVQEVSMGVPNKPKSLLRFDLSEEDLCLFKFWDYLPCQDFAVGPCDAELRRAMIVGDAKFLKLNQMVSPLDDNGMYLLFGFSASESRAKVNDLFYVPSKDGYSMLHSADMAAFAPKCFEISVPKLLEDGRFESTVLTDGVTSVKGLSGGFIVKVFRGKQLQDFEFVGIQSEQVKVGERLVSIRFSMSDVVMDCLDYFVDSLSCSSKTT